MAQEQVQIQTQKQQQVQRLSQQQMLQVKLLEMPLTELEESVNAELDDNPALEAGGEETDSIDDNDTVEHSEDDDFDTMQEREERQDALDSALERMRSMMISLHTIQDSNEIMLNMRRLCMEIQRPLLINSMSRWAKESLRNGRRVSWSILSVVLMMTDSCVKTSIVSVMSWLSTMELTRLQRS